MDYITLFLHQYIVTIAVTNFVLNSRTSGIKKYTIIAWYYIYYIALSYISLVQNLSNVFCTDIQIHVTNGVGKNCQNLTCRADVCLEFWNHENHRPWRHTEFHFWNLVHLFNFMSILVYTLLSKVLFSFFVKTTFSRNTKSLANDSKTLWMCLVL